MRQDPFYDQRFAFITSTVELRNKRFAEFWQAYPKKVAKPVAEKAFAKLNPTSELLANIITAIETYQQTSHWREQQGKFIPHPATFLNQRRWEDVLVPIVSPVGMTQTLRNHWRDECQAVHAGRCTNYQFHQAMMQPDEEDTK
jgi:hypothetical protein